MESKRLWRGACDTRGTCAGHAHGAGAHRAAGEGARGGGVGLSGCGGAAADVGGARRVALHLRVFLADVHDAAPGAVQGAMIVTDCGQRRGLLTHRRLLLPPLGLRSRVRGSTVGCVHTRECIIAELSAQPVLGAFLREVLGSAGGQAPCWECRAPPGAPSAVVPAAAQLTYSGRVLPGPSPADACRQPCPLQLPSLGLHLIYSRLHPRDIPYR